MKASELRNNTRKALSLYIQIDSNIDKLEKLIYNESKQHPNIIEYYKNLTYEICILLSKKTKLNTISNIIKNKQVFWGHSNFNEISSLIQEQNDFIKNPFEVEEGIFQCKAFDIKTQTICGSRRVYSYAKQDRSSDEGTSVYAQCMKCGCKWRERG